MVAEIIKGREIADKIKQNIKQQVLLIKEKYKTQPNIATIKIGEDPASNLYLKLRDKACELVGINSEHVFYNEEWWQENKKVYKDDVIVGEELYIENEYFDSRTKGANEWFEIGIPNKDYGKNGFFQTIESNDS